MNIYSSNNFLKKIQSLDGSLKNFLIMCVKQNESGSLNDITELRLLISSSIGGMFYSTFLSRNLISVTRNTLTPMTS